jgi:ribulose-bisphosphate carboxylase large chain
MLNRDPMLGFDYAVFQKLWRLAGVDQLHVNGPRSKFWEPDDSVIRSAKACLKPFAGTQPITPVFSSGQSAEQAPDTFAALGSSDVIYRAGGGIIGHPSGPKAGVQSLREAWEAAVRGVALSVYAESRPALRDALKAFPAGKGLIDAATSSHCLLRRRLHGFHGRHGMPRQRGLGDCAV